MSTAYPSFMTRADGSKRSPNMPIMRTYGDTTARKRNPSSEELGNFFDLMKL
jgi:hypothetical protein